MKKDFNVDKEIQELAVMRLRVIRREETIDNLRQSLKKTPLGKSLALNEAALQSEKDALNEAERDVRANVEEYFRNTGDLNAHPAVTIQQRTVLEYDEKEAITWAESVDEKMVKKALVKTIFNKTAKALKPDCVEIKKEPRATVASDLMPYVPKEETETEEVGF